MLSLVKKIPVKAVIYVEVAIFYLFLALIMTWPLVTVFSTHILGNPGDSPLYIWNQWWFKYSVLAGHNPLDCYLIAHPFGADLSSSATTFTNAFLANLLFFFLPIVEAFNSFFILSLVLAAMGAFLLIDYLFKSKFAALIGGAMFVFNSYIFSKIDHYNYSSVYLMPFFVLFFVKSFLEERRKRYAIAAAIVLAMSFYNDYYYTIGLFMVSALMASYFFFKQKKRRLANLKNLSLFFFVWLALSLPLLLSAVSSLFSGDFPMANIGQVSLYSPDVRSFLIPPAGHTVFGQYFSDYGKSLSYHGSVVYSGFLLLIMSVLGYFFGRKKEAPVLPIFWFLFTLFFFFVVVGPIFYMKDVFAFPAPYRLLAVLPIIKGILVPCRLVIFMILGLIIMSSFFLADIFARIKMSLTVKAMIAFCFVGVFLFENFSLPLPVNDVSIPEVYQKIAGDGQNGAILELPFALSTSFFTIGNVPSSAVLQYYQTAHRKNILGGYISRVPDKYPDFYGRLGGVNYLFFPERTLTGDELETVSLHALNNLKGLGVDYVIVHAEYYDSVRLKNTLSFLTFSLKVEPERDGQTIIYKISKD